VAEAHPDLRIVANPVAKASWVLTAAEFVNGYQLAQKNGARAILMLGPEAGSLGLPALREFGHAVTANSTDLAVARYDLQPRAGLVNSAILYPLSRALFASRTRYPLAIDLGLSPRMAERLAVAGQRFTSLNQKENVSLAGERGRGRGIYDYRDRCRLSCSAASAEPDLNTILPSLAGSLFADIEAKAAFWQRPRQAPQMWNSTLNGHPQTPMLRRILLRCCRLFTLHIRTCKRFGRWFLPPNTLLGLKRLSLTDGAAFRMPESLWARIVYDFLLAHRLRTINRGHLLGALIPLYLHGSQVTSTLCPRAWNPSGISRRWPRRLKSRSRISSLAGAGQTGSIHEKTR